MALAAAGETPQENEPSAKSSSDSGVSREVLEHGSALYHSFCQGCHGAEGGARGEFSDWFDPPPTPLSTKAELDALGKVRFVRYVKSGGKHAGQGTAMPSFKGRFTLEQAEDLWAFLNHLAQRSEQRDGGPTKASKEYPRDDEGRGVEVLCTVETSQAVALLQENSPHLGGIEPGQEGLSKVQLGGPPDGKWLLELGLNPEQCGEPVTLSACPR